MVDVISHLPLSLMSPCAIYHRNALSLAAVHGQPEVSTPAGPRKDLDGL